MRRRTSGWLERHTSSERSTAVSDQQEMNETPDVEGHVNEMVEVVEEPDVEGHRLVESPDVVEEPDVEGHMFEQVEHLEHLE